jgi:quinol monooxygenase YgiN
VSDELLQSVLWLEPGEDGLEPLIEEYRRVGVIEAAVPFGLLRGEAITIAGDERTLLVTSVWATPQSYDDWLASEERVRVTRGVDPLLAAPARIERVQVPADAVREPVPVDALVEGRAVDRVIVVTA